MELPLSLSCIILCLLCYASIKDVQCTLSAHTTATSRGILKANARHEGNHLVQNLGKDSFFQETHQNCSDSNSCPPWFYCSNETSKCKCGRTHNHKIHCDNDYLKSSVLDCYCVTTNYQGKTVLGSCAYNCANNNDRSDDVYW